MKMYILIKEDVPDRFAPVIAAHASLACYKKFEKEEEMQKWMASSFRKVICRVTAKEFEYAKKESKQVVLTESALDHAEVGLAFCPRKEYAKSFNYFRMWQPNQ